MTCGVDMSCLSVITIKHEGTTLTFNDDNSKYTKDKSKLNRLLIELYNSKNLTDITSKINIA